MEHFGTAAAWGPACVCWQMHAAERSIAFFVAPAYCPHSPQHTLLLCAGRRTPSVSTTSGGGACHGERAQGVGGGVPGLVWLHLGS